jgi:hypothetical protein
MDLIDLAAKCESSTGPDRELDLAIACAISPNGAIANLVGNHPRGLEGKEGMAWDVHQDAVIFEKYTADGRCPFNGGHPLPAYTSSLDAALSLVPASCIWTIETDAAWVRYMIGDHVAEEQSVLCGREGKSTALALTAAALKARNGIANTSTHSSGVHHGD